MLVEQPELQSWSGKMGDDRVRDIIDQQLLICQGHILAPFSGGAWRLPDVDDGAVYQFDGANRDGLPARARLGELKFSDFEDFGGD